MISIRVLLAAVKSTDTGKRSAAENPAARNPDIDHRHDCAPVSAIAVMIDGLVVGHGRPKAR